MTLTKAYRTVAVLAVVAAAGVWALGGEEEGIGAVASASAVLAWVTWVLVRRGRDPQKPDGDATPLTDDHCLNAMGVVLAVYLVLQYLVRDEPAAEGAIGVNALIALYLTWAYFGTRWLDRRRSITESSST